MKFKKTVYVNLLPEEIKALSRAINFHYLNDEECNKLVDGEYVSKYPEKECKELIDAGYAIHRTYTTEVEVEFSEVTGCPIGWKLVGSDEELIVGRVEETNDIIQETLDCGFSGVTKEEYEAMTANQRVIMATGNWMTLEELDKHFGVHTDIGSTDEEKEEFYKQYRERQHRVAKIALKSMPEAFFKMPENYTGNGENIEKEDKMNKTENIMEELEEAGYDAAIAVATESEINAGAACGQLAIIEEENE
jgi:hypothetical protein